MNRSEAVSYINSDAVYLPGHTIRAHVSNITMISVLVEIVSTPDTSPDGNAIYNYGDVHNLTGFQEFPGDGDLTEEAVQDMVMVTVAYLHDHELRERLRFDGTAVYHPHTRSGNDRHTVLVPTLANHLITENRHMRTASTSQNPRKFTPEQYKIPVS